MKKPVSLNFGCHFHAPPPIIPEASVVLAAHQICDFVCLFDFQKTLFQRIHEVCLF
jgi:hypothetical protein